MIRKASFVLAVTVLAATVATSGALTASAQSDSVPITKLDRQLARVDIGISGAGEFNRTATGTIIPAASPNAGQPVSDQVSNTLGALVSVRYIARPYVGLEFNYTYARYTENFSYPPPAFGVQTQANEFTLGYVITPAHQLFGFQPFVSAGLGSMEFKPTPRGGEGLTRQARAAYYYSAGLQQEYMSGHFGLRASFRQVIYLDPDFGQNYLTIKQHTITTEPTAGFYFRF